eukprot:1159258-Pelagomonas_calceolata.AAC.1
MCQGGNHVQDPTGCMQHAVPRPGVSSQALSSGAFRQRNSSLSALQQRQSSSCSRFLLSSLATAQPIYKTTLKQHGQSRVSVQAATVEQVTAAKDFNTWCGPNSVSAGLRETLPPFSSEELKSRIKWVATEASFQAFHSLSAGLLALS